jgi:hypothetical protein
MVHKIPYQRGINNTGTKNNTGIKKNRQNPVKIFNKKIYSASRTGTELNLTELNNHGSQ